MDADRSTRADGRATEGHLPRALSVPALLGIALLTVPLGALVAQAHPASLWAGIAAPESRDALFLSLVTGLVATAICLLVGLPLALLIARARPWLAAVLRVLVTVPVLLPPMVGGVALLYLFGRSSPAASWLATIGVTLPSSIAAVVTAQVFVALPFLVLAVEGVVRAAGVGYERAAASLGAGRWATFARITLPIAAPGLAAGIVLCFARAVGEFGATALFAGDAPGVTRTMPLAIYAAFAGSGVGEAAAVALSLLLLVTTVAALLLVRAWRPGNGR